MAISSAVLTPAGDKCLARHDHIICSPASELLIYMQEASSPFSLYISMGEGLGCESGTKRSIAPGGILRQVFIALKK